MLHVFPSQPCHGLPEAGWQRFSCLGLFHVIMVYEFLSYFISSGMIILGKWTRFSQRGWVRCEDPAGSPWCRLRLGTRFLDVHHFASFLHQSFLRLRYFIPSPRTTSVLALFYKRIRQTMACLQAPIRSPSDMASWSASGGSLFS